MDITGIILCGNRGLISPVEMKQPWFNMVKCAEISDFTPPPLLKLCPAAAIHIFNWEKIRKICSISDKFQTYLFNEDYNIVLN